MEEESQTMGGFGRSEYFGKVNHVHPKTINGQTVSGPHYTPTRTHRCIY